jgi:hypothetical protein
VIGNESLNLVCNHLVLRARFAIEVIERFVRLTSLAGILDTLPEFSSNFISLRE